MAEGRRRPPPKSEWGPGPWQDEPDSLTWTAGPEGRRYVLVAQRAMHFGHWCGYVGVPGNHPAAGFSSYKDEVSILEVLHRLAGGTLKTWCEVRLAVNELSVHGGITYAGDGRILPNPLWGDRHFFGFDCGHAGDLSPARLGTLLSAAVGTLLSAVPQTDVYRDLGYVKREIKDLAGQLWEIDKKFGEAVDAIAGHNPMEDDSEPEREDAPIAGGGEG